jgi:hypothetical protein
MELIQIPKLNGHSLNSNSIIELRFNWKKMGMQIDGLNIKNLFVNMMLKKKNLKKKTKKKTPLLGNGLNRF